MSHSVILLGIADLQGAEVTGTGTLQTLKNLLPTVETCEEQEEPRSLSSQAVVDQSERVAELFTNGLTTATLATQTGILSTNVNSYLEQES